MIKYIFEIPNTHIEKKTFDLFLGSLREGWEKPFFTRWMVKSPKFVKKNCFPRALRTMV